MKFDLIELFQYLGLDGNSALVVIIIGLVFWIILSDNKIADKFRKRIIKTFSRSSSEIHREQERLAEAINNDIDVILRHLQEETNADNVVVVRFRNGSYDSMGSSILKFYASNERPKPGYPRIGDKIQNISRSLYAKFCDTLIKEHKVYIKDKDSIENNHSELLNLMSLFGEAEKFYARSLTTSTNNQIIGFVCVIYKEEYRIAESRIDHLLTETTARIVAKLEMSKLEKSKKNKSDTLK